MAEIHQLIGVFLGFQHVFLRIPNWWFIGFRWPIRRMLIGGFVTYWMRIHSDRDVWGLHELLPK